MESTLKRERKCTRCDKSPRKYYLNGVFKNYTKTCGSKSCLLAATQDAKARLAKGRLKLARLVVCELCGSENIIYARQGRFCQECIPTKSWEHRALRYGIGKPQWDKLLKQQNGTCATCDKEAETVDHNHTTGTVRGLLCNRCNLVVGVLENASQWIEKMIKYIDR